MNMKMRATGLALTAVLLVAALPTSAQELDFAVQAGGTGNDQGYGIAVDGSGGSTVTGRFQGTATFGAPGNQTTLTAAGFFDIFVARYNSDGSLAFAVQAGGTGFDEGLGIGVDGSGASTVTGRFSGTATFGAPGNQTILTAAAGSGDIFVARYNPDGTLDFAVQAGGTGQDQGEGIAVDGSGASTVTGRFSGTATFGAPGNQIILTAAGSGDIFVARYNPDGSLDFAVQAGGTGLDQGLGIAVDGSGASTVTGLFQGTATFGAPGNQTILTAAAGREDIFVARYNLDGTLDFAVQAGGTGNDQGFGIAVDGSGGSTVTGWFSGTATFGAPGNQTILTAAGFFDIFVARYNPDGSLDFAVQAGGTGFDAGSGIAVDGSGASTVTGAFSGTATFGAPGNQTILTSVGNNDIFVARYNPDGSLDFAVQAGGTGVDRGFGIAVDGSGASTVTGQFEGTATFGAPGNQTILTAAAGSNDIFVAKYAGGSPEAQIEALIEEVEAASLSRGLENSLTKKLSNAQGSLARGQTKGAVGKLNAFINQVEAQSGKKIDVADADAWIADAQAIIDELEA